MPLSVEAFERIAAQSPHGARFRDHEAPPHAPARVDCRSALGRRSTTVELARRSGQTIDRVLATLLDLEISGPGAGSRYVRRAPMARL
jgi:hypothetical protein